MSPTERMRLLRLKQQEEYSQRLQFLIFTKTLYYAELINLINIQILLISSAGQVFCVFPDFI